MTEVIILNIFETEPFFVNEEGTKWWKDDSLTKYCRNPDINGIVLNGTVCYVERADGYRTRVLVMNDKIIEEDQTMDGLGIKIEMRKFLIHDHEKNPDVEPNKNKNKVKNAPKVSPSSNRGNRSPRQI